MTDDCGCVGIHDWLTHEEYHDIRDEARNRRLLRSALIAGHHAEEQARYAMEAEVRRLAEKQRLMAAGLIRDLSSLTPRDRSALERARDEAFQ